MDSEVAAIPSFDWTPRHLYDLAARFREVYDPKPLPLAFMKSSAKMILETRIRKARATLFCVLLFGMLAAGGCGTASYQAAPPDPAMLHGKSQAWFQEHWGAPGAKAKRFFGGETWVYLRLTGTSSSPLSPMAPADCQVRLDFDEKGTLEDSRYSGC